MGGSFSQTDGAALYTVTDTKHNTRARTNPIYTGCKKPQQNGRILQSEGSSSKPSPTKAKSNSASNRGRFWQAVFITFAILDVLLLCLLVKVSVDLFRSRETSSQPHQLLEDAPFCLPCSEVYMTELEVLQNRSQLDQRSDKKNRTLLCCAESHDDLSTLVGNMYLRVHYSSDRARGLVKWSNDTTNGTDQSSRVNAHLLLSLDHNKELTEVKGTHAVPLVSNLTAEAKEYDSHSVVFHNGSIRIIHTGHYYIYSQIPFKFKSSSSSESLTQFVFRSRNGGELLLLENSVYPCVVGTESCEFSFVGGMFLLEERDEISLRVSMLTCIEREKEMKFGIQRV
ncbi:uncharacterized protein [Littorina saxatilis]|uniref:THD domain-containing protein n=1 Tax=Littorina saxatilis TaxID=31220 RepID=A0AAN9APN0_9CAEN